MNPHILTTQQVLLAVTTNFDRVIDAVHCLANGLLTDPAGLDDDNFHRLVRLCRKVDGGLATSLSARSDCTDGRWYLRRGEPLPPLSEIHNTEGGGS